MRNVQFVKFVCAILLITTFLGSTVAVAQPKSLWQWQGWENLGPSMGAQIDCVAPQINSVGCFGIGPSGKLERKSFDGNSWGRWEYPGIVIGGNGLSTVNAGSIDPVGVDCLSYDLYRVDCFAIGNNNALYHRWWDNGSEGWWENLGGAASGMPSCVSMMNKRIDCFVPTGSGNLQWAMWDGNVWVITPNNSNLSGSISSGTRPACVGWQSAGGPRIDCVANTLDSSGMHNQLSALSFIPQSTMSGTSTWTSWSWSGWSPITTSGTTVASDVTPKCVANNGTLFCIAWATWPDGTQRMTRWTLGAQGWAMSDLANDSGDSTTGKQIDATTGKQTYGGRTWRDFDCIARGTDAIDCFEFVGRLNMTTSVPPYPPATSVHLRRTSWSASAVAAQPTTTAQWTTLDTMIPQYSFVYTFAGPQLKCTSWAVDRIDCFVTTTDETSTPWQSVLMHASSTFVTLPGPLRGL